MIARESPDGRTNRRAGSDRFLHQPRRSYDLSDREITDPEISRRRAHATGRQIQSPRLPRFRLEKRKRAVGVAGVGVLGRRMSCPAFLRRHAAFGHWKLGRLAASQPSQASCLTSESIEDLESHLPGSAGDDAESGFVVTRVQVFALGVDDVQHLFATDFSDFGLVRLFRTCSDVRGLLEQNSRWRTLGNERKRFVFEDSDHYRKNITSLLLCG